MPATTPFAEPTVAIPGIPELQVPPVVEFDKVIDEPAHTLIAPSMAAGSGCTVTIAMR